MIKNIIEITFVKPSVLVFFECKRFDPEYYRTKFGMTCVNPEKLLQRHDTYILAHQIDEVYFSMQKVICMEACVQCKSLLLGSCFGAPKVSHEEAASAEVISKRWPKVPFHGASAF
jgi:hypothetical protein